ncbi:MAG: hypothetical protein ACLQPD_04820 [Desulfomonilaceae bacterium]
MKTAAFGVVFTAFILHLASWPCFAQWQSSPPQPRGFAQNTRQVLPQTTPQPVARSVSVKVPIYSTPPALSPYPCGDLRRRQSWGLPVRVEVAVKPENACDNGRVPVVFQDPGPLQPIICSGVGLVGAVVAAPFRVAEMFCPLPPRPCKPAIAPPYGPVPPVPPCQPVCPPMPSYACSPPGACLQPVACAPAGPAVAPLPPAPCAPRCGPNVPPRLVEEYQFPQYEAQDLLSGIWNFPETLIRTGRLAGDIHKTSPCGPPAGW